MTGNGNLRDEGGRTAPFVAPGWDLGRVRLESPGRPLIVGVVNLTPDSFWADSRPAGVDAAVEHALRLCGEGADLLDLGAESSRPGAEPVGEAEEMERLLPVLRAVRRETALPLSVDTVRSATARAALDEGADVINDISAGTWDPLMLDTVADSECGVVLMHMNGSPRTMQDDPVYGDVVSEVTGWLAARCALAEEAGVATARIVVDPGIGFGKLLPHNLALLRKLDQLAGGRPLLLGASRKSFIGQLTGAPAASRLPGSLAALTAAWRCGATAVRVHDVGASRQFLDVLSAIEPTEGA